MPQTKREIQSILAAAGMSPRHRFGQNFMIDANMIRTIADAGEIAPGQTVIEVGPGTGTLTDELLARGADVLAVEIDRDLAGVLRDRFATKPNFRLIEGDALDGKHALNPELQSAINETKHRGVAVKLVANLPYNIASPLVIELLLAGVDLLVFVVQKEVALRLASPHGGEDYGPLTVMAQLLARGEILRKIPPAVFWPPPTIDSALVRMRREDRLGINARAFGEFMHRVFSYRRKTLRKALSEAGFEAKQVFTDSIFSPNVRVEVLSPPELVKLFFRIYPSQMNSNT